MWGALIGGAASAMGYPALGQMASTAFNWFSGRSGLKGASADMKEWIKYYKEKADAALEEQAKQFGWTADAIAQQKEMLGKQIELIGGDIENKKKFLGMQEQMIGNALREGKIDRLEAKRLRSNLIGANQQLTANMEQALVNLGPMVAASPDQLMRDYDRLREHGYQNVDRAVDRASSMGHADRIRMGRDRGGYAVDQTRAMAEQANRMYDEADISAYNEAMRRTGAYTDLMNKHRAPYMNEIQHVSQFPVNTWKDALNVNIPKTGYATAAQMYGGMANQQMAPMMAPAVAGYQNLGNAHMALGGNYGTVADMMHGQVAPYRQGMASLGQQQAAMDARYGNQMGGYLKQLFGGQNSGQDWGTQARGEWGRLWDKAGSGNPFLYS